MENSEAGVGVDAAVLEAELDLDRLCGDLNGPGEHGR